MTTQLELLLDPSKIVGQREGVYLTDIDDGGETGVARTAWERIYDFDLVEFEQERPTHGAEKLDDHLAMIRRYKSVSEGDVYLEIGCGPAYVGECLMKRCGVAFIGIDFNFKILQTLRQYLERRGLSNHLLIHADINTMPLRDSCVDLVYGGGVIEHSPDTCRVLRESRRVLRQDGVSFNTVPAFNLSWPPLRFYNNIPAVPWLRAVFTYIHTAVLKNRVLEGNYGYELSFTRNELIDLHRRAGFGEVSAGPLAFHPSPSRVKSAMIRSVYYWFAGRRFLAPIYYAAATR